MSYYARQAIKTYIQDNMVDEDLIDFTGAYGELQQILADNNIQPESPFLAIEFQGGEVAPKSLAATRTSGLYRETGIFELHIAQKAAFGVQDSLPQRADALIKLFNLGAAKIGLNNDIGINGCTDLVTGVGGTLDFEAGYVAGTIRVSYYRDIGDPRTY